MITDANSLVGPFYLRLLRGNFLREEEAERAAFWSALHDAASNVEPSVLVQLLERREWRGRLSAAWFAGLLRMHVFEDRISSLLLESELCFSGQGYCFALARFGSRSASDTLRRYLDKYLPVGPNLYDQEWAIGALHHISPSQAATVSREDAMWHPLSPAGGITMFESLMVQVDREWGV